MKRGIFLSIILSLALVAYIPQAMAQKQSRMEKLLRYLNDNDADKWQKNREKVDDETQAYYAEELELLDVLNELWNNQSEQAATNYFGCYEKAAKAYFPNICEEEKIQISNVQDKAEQSIIYILEASKDRIPFSRTLMDSIHSSGYPADSALMQKIRDIREMALLESILKAPAPSIYQTYMAEYPNGKFASQVNAAENKRLYQIVKSNPTQENFKAFFDNPAMQKFFTDKDTRPFLAEAQALYDNYLFHSIDSLWEGGNATAIRQIIDDYKHTPYLNTTARTHLGDLEYLSEKADFELLKPAIVSSESLGLLQEFLSTHKYKEFRDQANALRTPFILQAIISTPTSVKYYNAGRLIKSAENDSTGNISTTYSYDDKGQLVSTLSLTMKNGQASNEVQTNRLYDPQGRCIFEVQTNPKTKTDIYRRTCRIGADGSIESDSLKYTDGKLIISTYNKQGLLTEAKEYNKNGELQAYTANKYDDKGRLVASQHQNLLFANSPDQVISQKDAYEYDKYGYLTQIVYQRIMGNNQKTSGCLTCLYDKYGNRIDGNSYYEYDNTGQWIYRTNRDNPKEVERIQYIYK
ncbi:RHS repeat protein [Bacteroides acidifaciens]|uniref:RHS repeat protein n=1 Tax=Bacteroides acidifaciens TaxID=85831 RepID=UPI0023BE6598|nr:RHS repeat protein [Bacteroides acidifaciens]MDE6821860.1 RHS repeat protein [Bacteroides acidifaciens]